MGFYFLGRWPIEVDLPRPSKGGSGEEGEGIAGTAFSNFPKWERSGSCEESRREFQRERGDDENEEKKRE